MNVKDIKKVAVLGGGGMIGSCWALNFLWKGYPAHIFDINEEALQNARNRIAAGFDFLVKRNILTADKAHVAMGLANTRPIWRRPWRTSSSSRRRPRSDTK